MSCARNRVPNGAATSTASRVGARKIRSGAARPFKRLVERARPKPEAKFVIQHADNAYTTSLPLEAMLGDDVLVAWEFDGSALEPIHGGPVRMLVPKLYFWKSAKWINNFEFVAEDQLGFWEKRGYHNEADPWKEQRYSDLPNWFG